MTAGRAVGALDLSAPGGVALVGVDRAAAGALAQILHAAVAAGLRVRVELLWDPQDGPGAGSDG